MNFASNATPLLVLQAEQACAQPADSLLGIASLSDIKRDDAYLKDAIAFIFDRKVVDQPVAGLARFVGQFP